MVHKSVENMRTFSPQKGEEFGQFWESRARMQTCCVNFCFFCSQPRFSFQGERERLMIWLGPLTFTLADDGQSALNNSPQKNACIEEELVSQRKIRMLLTCFEAAIWMLSRQKSLGDHYWFIGNWWVRQETNKETESENVTASRAL